MGMPEYRDGTYGAIKPIAEALQDLNDSVNVAKTKALHIGPFNELAERVAHPLEEPEPLAKLLQMEVDLLHRKVNRILIKLGLDDKTEVLKV